MPQKGFVSLLFITTVLLLGGLIITGAFFIKKNFLNKSSTIIPAGSTVGSKSTPNLKPTNLEKSNNEAVKSWQVFYSHSKKSPIDGELKFDFFNADLSGQGASLLDPNLTKDVIISSDGKTMAKVTKYTIEVSPRNDFTNFKKVWDVTGQPGHLGYPTYFWSSDGSKLLFEDRWDIYSSHGSEADYYSVDMDGGNLKLLGKISNYPGGHFEGFNSSKNVIFATETINPPSEFKLVSFDLATQQIKDLKNTSDKIDYEFNLDYSKIYFLENGNTIVEYDPFADSQRIVYTLKSDRYLGQVTGTSFRLFPSGKSLVLSVNHTDGSNLKYLIKILDGSVDLSLISPDFNQYGVNYPYISPDGKYLVLYKEKSDIPVDKNKLNQLETQINGIDQSKLNQSQIDSLLKQDQEVRDPGVYGDRICIVDLITKNVLPFFNCSIGVSNFQSKINEQVYFLGWLAR